MRRLAVSPGAVALLAVTALAAVWREDWSLHVRDRGAFVIAALWADGKAVWSKDDVLGGPPYYQGRIPSEALEITLRQLESGKVFAAPLVRRNDFGPDSFFTGTYLILSGRDVCQPVVAGTW